MIKFFLTFAILLLISVQSYATEARKVQVKPALIRGDGMLVNSQGKIIGVRNVNDARATPYEFYYFGVKEGNKPTARSVYRVYQNPNTSKVDYVMERIIPRVVNDSEIITKSAANQNVIFTAHNAIYFNGKKIESGAVVNGAVVTLVKGKLRYGGKVIQSGTMVRSGEVVPRG